MFQISFNFISMITKIGVMVGLIGRSELSIGSEKEVQGKYKQRFNAGFSYVYYIKTLINLNCYFSINFIGKKQK